MGDRNGKYVRWENSTPLKKMHSHPFAFSMQSWWNALQFCRSLGPNVELAKIKYETQRELLHKVIDKAKGKGHYFFWIAGNDLAQEGDYIHTETTVRSDSCMPAYPVATWHCGGVELA